jgi:hypothetical protein
MRINAASEGRRLEHAWASPNRRAALASLALMRQPAKYHDLLITNRIRGFEPVNADVTEMCGKSLTAFGQPITGAHEYYYTTRFQPAIRAAKEHLRAATTISRF